MDRMQIYQPGTGRWLHPKASANVAPPNLKPLVLVAWRTGGKAHGWAYGIVAPQEAPGEIPSPLGFGMLVCRVERKVYRILAVCTKLPYDIVIGLARRYGTLNELMRQIPNAKHMLEDPFTAAILYHGTTEENQMNDDQLTAKHTAFSTMQDLLEAKGGYFPTLHTQSADTDREELGRLADAYDAYQHARGDSRRAMRV